MDVSALTLHVPERFPQLVRACRSVYLQQYDNIHHMIFVDGNIPDSKSKYYDTLKQHFPISIYETDRPSDISSTSSRVADLRETALSVTESSLIAWLDDDNWWQHDHISSLLRKMANSGVEAAYSYRTLWTPTGRPFSMSTNPWQDEPRKYLHILQENNISSPNSPIMQDGILEISVDGYKGTIDIGEWLFSKDLVREIGIPRPQKGKWMDDRITNRLLDMDVRFHTTARPTLNYTVGCER